MDALPWLSFLFLNFTHSFSFEENYERYTNHGLHVSGQAIVNNFQLRTFSLISAFHLLISNVSTAPPTVFDLLRPDYVQAALYNSSKREAEHAVTCQPKTRDKILDEVRSWADSPTTPVCWLSGPAGTGKTTVAHTIAEEYDERGQLAATFFLWRKTGDRDDINKIVPTLAYQIAEKIPSAKERMEKIFILKDTSRAPLMDPLSRFSLKDQLSKLLITTVNPTDPNLIVIDGLDECSSREGICQLIELIRKNKCPFRFLFTSRPEPEFQHCILSDGPGDVRTLSLTESKESIRKYFVEQLEKVWPKQQRIKDDGPLQWPPTLYLDKLVEKSEGLFVYAATAVRYIGGDGLPQQRLENVLKSHKGLDSLYVQVIEEAKKQDHFDIVLGGIMYLRYQLKIDDLSRILLPLNEYLTSPSIRITLRRCHSILVIPDDNSKIELYHASLRDFLTNDTRSRTLFRAPAMCHGWLLFGCLSAITRAFSDGTPAPVYGLVSWYYHACFFLSTGSASEELKDKVQELFMKINLNWVKSWMSEALYWGGILYLRGDFITKVQKVQK